MTASIKCTKCQKILDVPIPQMSDGSMVRFKSVDCGLYTHMVKFELSIPIDNKNIRDKS